MHLAHRVHWHSIRVAVNVGFSPSLLRVFPNGAAVLSVTVGLDRGAQRPWGTSTAPLVRRLLEAFLTLAAGRV